MPASKEVIVIADGTSSEEEEVQCVDSKLAKVPLKRTESPVKEAEHRPVEDDDEGLTCCICLEIIGDRGPHKAACLKCGHVFGKKCIQKWLAENKNKKCPQCNKKARVSDVVELFNLPKVAAADPALLEEQEKKAQQAEREKQAAIKEKERLQQQLAEMQRLLKQQQAGTTSAAFCHSNQANKPTGPLTHPPAGPGAFQQNVTQQPYASHFHPRGMANWAMHHPTSQSQGFLQPAQPSLHATAMSPASFNQHQWPQQQTANYMGPEEPCNISLQQQPLNAAGTRGQGNQPAQPHGHDSYQSHCPPPSSNLYQQRMSSPNPPLHSHGPRHPANMQSCSTLHHTSAASVPSVVAIPVSTWPHNGINHVYFQVAPHLAASSACASKAYQAVNVQSGHLCSIDNADHPPGGTRNTLAAAQVPACLMPGEPMTDIQLQPMHLFEKCQDYTTQGCRCFGLHVPSALLLIPETIAGPPGSSSRSHVRKISILCPVSHFHIQLPSDTGIVRDIQLSTPRKLAAVASASGISIISTASDNVVVRYKTPAPAWCCSWSCHNENLLYVGLQNGTAALADLRKASGEVMQFGTGLQAPMPVHSIAALPACAASHGTGNGDDQPDVQPPVSLQQLSNWRENAECLFACASGVYAASSDATVLVAAPMGSSSACASMAVSSSSSSYSSAVEAGNGISSNADLCSRLSGITAAVSWRNKPTAMAAAYGLVAARPCHRMFTVESLGCGSSNQAAAPLSGHTSSLVQTRGCFVTPSSQSDALPPFFCSADEDTRSAWIWDVRSNCVVQRLESHSEAVTLALAGSSSDLGTVLGTCSASKLQLFKYSG